jgi:hypothetical protein
MCPGSTKAPVNINVLASLRNSRQHDQIRGKSCKSSILNINRNINVAQKLIEV